MTRTTLAFFAFALGLCGVLGWFADPYSKSDVPKLSESWSYAFQNKASSGMRYTEPELSTKATLLNRGFLFPKDFDAGGQNTLLLNTSKMSDEERPVPEPPVIAGSAIKNDKLVLYIFQNDRYMDYVVGDELLSGWRIEAAGLDFVDLKFDNIEMTIDVLPIRTVEPKLGRGPR